MAVLLALWQLWLDDGTQRGNVADRGEDSRGHVCDSQRKTNVGSDTISDVTSGGEEVDIVSTIYIEDTMIIEQMSTIAM